MASYEIPSSPPISIPPPHTPANWLDPPTRDVSNTLNAVTTKEIQTTIASSRLDSATGSDNISYRMVTTVQHTNPELLYSLFTNLLYHKVFPVQWKKANCIPIPKRNRTNTSDPKNLRPISQLSCLGKTFMKILARRIEEISRRTGAMTNEQFGSLSNRSSLDALMINLTQAQEWVHMLNTHKSPVIHPKILANDIDRAFNCVAHERLNDILRHYKFPPDLTETIKDFNHNRTIFLTCEGEVEDPVPFRTRLLQGSPLSLVLFVIYAAALNKPGPQPRL